MPIRLIYTHTSIHSGPDIADISRIFFEVIRSELNANQMPEIVIRQKPCAAHTNASGTDAEITPSESDFEHDPNPSKRKSTSFIRCCIGDLTIFHT